MTLISLINKKLAIETIIAQAALILSLIYLLFLRKKYGFILEFIGKYALFFAFIVSLASLISSLFYSQIAGFAPCELCWIQRIFMYPLVVLLMVAWIKKDSKITDYILSLSIIGGLVSLFHDYLYYSNSGLSVYCQLGGSTVSCVKRYVFEFGYITIPMMALTGFLLIIMLMIFRKLYERTYR